MCLFWLPSLKALNTYSLDICCILGLGFTEASKAHFLFLRKSHTAVSSHLQFCFLQFQYPWSTAVQKCEMKNSRNKQFISFKLHAFLSSLMKSCVVLPETCIISLFSISMLYTLHALQSLKSLLGYQINHRGITVPVSK